MKTVCSLLSVLLWAASSPARGADSLAEKVSRSTAVIENLLQGANPPARLILDATTCVIVIPRLIKGALGIGGRRGKGVISCRGENQAWGPPVFVKLAGGSIGLQVGGQSSDLVLLIVNDRSVRSLLKSEFTLGADASVAAGPLSATAAAATDVRLDAEIYSYASSKGLFVGVAVDGAKLSLNRKAVSKYYDAYYRPEDILFGQESVSPPAEAQSFRSALP